MSHRSLVIVLLVALLGGCATAGASVRAPMSECTNRCFSAYLGTDARATCLRTCPGARSFAAACPAPPAAAMPCVQTAAASDGSEEYLDGAGTVAGEIVGGIFRELVFALLTAPFH
jgi:hypothetical protein